MWAVRVCSVSYFRQLGYERSKPLLLNFVVLLKVVFCAKELNVFG
jgi:hypothetical protein